MKTLINGELLAQALLESNFASKIGFTLIFTRRIDSAVVAYVIHKNKHYALSTAIPYYENMNDLPYEVYISFAIAKKFNPKKVCFIFDKQKKINKILNPLAKSCGFDYVVYLLNKFSDEMKAKHVLDSLLMHAEDGLFLKGLCELEVSLKSSNQEFKAEMYKLLGVYPCRSEVYFKHGQGLTKRRLMHAYLLKDIPDLDINEVILYEDSDDSMLVDALDVIEEVKADTVLVDSAPQFTMVDAVIRPLKNEILVDDGIEVVEGSIDL